MPKYKNKGKDKKLFYRQIVKEKSNGSLWRERKDKPLQRLNKLIVYGKLRIKRRKRRRNDKDFSYIFNDLIFNMSEFI